MRTRLVSYEQLKPEYGIGYTRTHLRRLYRAGKFPVPIQIGENRIGWSERELDDYVNQRMSQRHATAK